MISYMLVLNRKAAAALAARSTNTNLIISLAGEMQLTFCKTGDQVGAKVPKVCADI